jgi:tRNA (guanine37-N1)-methyltransferase
MHLKLSGEIKVMALKDILKESIPKRYHLILPSSFDILGSREKAVAIVEIPQELRKYRLKISRAIMSQHRNVKSVLDKGSPRKGVFRIRDYRILAGSKNTEVVHAESGCRFILDPREVYFSQREGTERLRIASMVKNREKVMVFFAGIGPFPLIISKKTGAEKIVGIEINPKAVNYFEKNIELNKCRNVFAVMGDVSKVSGNYIGFDRLIMPLPELSLKYLPEALHCLKKGGIIHIYVFAAEDDLQKIKSCIRSCSRKSGKKISFLGKTNVLPYGPGIWKMRLDIKMK